MSLRSRALLASALLLPFVPAALAEPPAEELSLYVGGIYVCGFPPRIEPDGCAPLAAWRVVAGAHGSLADPDGIARLPAAADDLERLGPADSGAIPAQHARVPERAAGLPAVLP